MKREVVATGKDIDEAIDSALIELGVDRDEASVEIIDVPSRGFLGLGRCPARVRVWVGEDEEPAPAPAPAPASAPVKKEAPAPAKKERGERSERRERGPRPEKREKPRAPRAEKPRAPRREESAPDAETVQAAREYFEGLCRQIGLPDTEVSAYETENKTLRVELHGEGMGMLIGKGGETMYALQYLASLSLNKSEGQFTRLELDIEGYREKRTAALEKLALRTAERAIKQKRNITMEYMQPYERRVIHATLQNHESVSTRSVGEDPFRRVIVVYEGRR